MCIESMKNMQFIWSKNTQFLYKFSHETKKYYLYNWFVNLLVKKG